ncbi:MAG: hypothetical protein ACOYL5_05565 [Phototrophicaceae bacterium]|jgi:hypothetical protein
MAKIVKTFAFLGAWQQLGLTLWCCGVVLAERCEVSAVADALVGVEWPSVAALEKRLSRWLTNLRISDEMLSQQWIKWVHRQLGYAQWVVVDETKLGDHLSVMMVGVAWRCRAIPLLWRCYSPKAYPAEGQVTLIAELIERLRLLLPASVDIVVQADRGIGTSPDLIDEFDRIGVKYLLRVQGQVRLRLKNGKEHALKTPEHSGVALRRYSKNMAGYACLCGLIGGLVKPRLGVWLPMTPANGRRAIVNAPGMNTASAI